MNNYDAEVKQHIKKLFAIKRADLLAQNSKYHSLLENIDKQEQTLLSLL